MAGRPPSYDKATKGMKGRARVERDRGEPEDEPMDDSDEIVMVGQKAATTTQGGPTLPVRIKRECVSPSTTRRAGATQASPSTQAGPSPSTRLESAAAKVSTPCRDGATQTFQPSES